jgi:exopolysaccharide production protein ExoZ
MTVAPSKSADLVWLQALRGIAALMVLFFHMLPHWELVSVLAVSSAISRWGFSGVDIFFALSGFVVYRSARRTTATQGIIPFIKKRLLRIYLGYWPILLLVAFTTVFIYQAELPDTKKMVFSALLFYPHIWDNWLTPAWSLSMEIYFYLWIALIALLPQRHQIKAIVIVMAILILWGVGWLIAVPALVYTGQQPLRYGLTGFGVVFLAGSLVAYAYERRSDLLKNTPVATALSIALIGAGLGIGMTSPRYANLEIFRIASFGIMGVGALVLALTLEKTPFNPPTWLVRTGDASYSLYLLHTFLLDMSARLLGSLKIASPTAMLIYMLLLPILIVIISMLWYRWVEKPIMKAVL